MAAAYLLAGEPRDVYFHFALGMAAPVAAQRMTPSASAAARDSARGGIAFQDAAPMNGEAGLVDAFFDYYCYRLGPRRCGFAATMKSTPADVQAANQDRSISAGAPSISRIPVA